MLKENHSLTLIVTLLVLQDDENNSDDELEYDPSMYPQRVGRQKHVLDIEFHFNDGRRGGLNRGRGGRPRVGGGPNNAGERAERRGPNRNRNDRQENDGNERTDGDRPSRPPRERRDDDRRERRAPYVSSISIFSKFITKYDFLFLWFASSSIVSYFFV